MDDRADVGPALVDDEVQADLAEHLAARRSTWPLPSTSIRSFSATRRFEVAVGVATKRLPSRAVTLPSWFATSRARGGGCEVSATWMAQLPHVQSRPDRRCRR